MWSFSQLEEIKLMEEGLINSSNQGDLRTGLGTETNQILPLEKSTLDTISITITTGYQLPLHLESLTGLWFE